MKRYLVAPFVIVLLGFAAQALAHHSFAATYVEDQSVTIEGQLVQFLLRNPHSFVHVMVKEKDGTTNRVDCAVADRAYRRYSVKKIQSHRERSLSEAIGFGFQPKSR